MYLYLNDQLMRREEAKVSIFDHGYLYGIGLFETFRTYSCVPFLLQEHLNRLKESCSSIGIDFQPDEQKIREQIAYLLQKNQLSDGYIRYNVSAGEHPLGLPSENYTGVTEAILIKPLPAPSDSKRLQTVNVRRNTPEGPFRYKSHQYINNLLAKREATAGTEGVMLTKEGYVAEGAVSNLFCVQEQKLLTPALDTGILNGITREWVIFLARSIGLTVEEGHYPLSEMKKADEVFITNSIQEIVPVKQWDEQSYRIGEPNAITNKLQEQYRLYIHEYISKSR